VKTAKRRITQIMPHDRPGTLVFKWDVLYRSCRISTDKRVAIAEPLVFSKSIVVHRKIGHVNKTTPLLGVICHPFTKT